MKKLIIAHRGFHKFDRENTIAAFNQAIEIGADGIEFDVRMTQDGILISHHDEMMENQYIKNLTYTQIKEISARKGFSVPSVEEVLKLVRGKIKLFVELKEKGYEDEIVKLLLRYLSLSEFVLISFHVKSIQVIQDHYPNVKIGLLLRSRKAKILGFLVKVLWFLPNAILFGANPDILLPHFDGYSLDLLKLAQRKQKHLVLWTVNDEMMMRRFMEEDMVEGIVTDIPDVAI
ncbi:MAG TPA: hypothetical protein DEG17_02275 [Cyanobacteria bacterium UBA11149]|nr:hypothetical protein [Cyanobacteria bacterium UBA11366]HBK63739.1 hypothetical protein [Cyanobacteria bacterium UBA11166]HBR72617.1 hypothetical protein [Cyanobacteria bacterium UBA11159]HBS72394.1 hypothetical protein [Cyanobacteria bacterium UBA11153]HBW87732.1 hypothetical protein [Cyanobacteria bacterium UBA11149]HCA98157.1 hypothetical protein [Cyanobacteria bacterium UBA9226]